MRLYTYQRNSAGERVRIALYLKGLSFEYISVPTIPPGEYRLINPQELMPTLEVGGRMIAQSGAILEYLEERWPDPPLLPQDPILRAQARAFGQHIASEMHAVTVNRVRLFLGTLGVDAGGISKWTAHWMAQGMAALERTLEQRSDSWPFCFGETPGWPDIHLVPQLRNARRFECDLTPYPSLTEIEGRCNAIEAFRKARPENQPDYRLD